VKIEICKQLQDEFQGNYEPSQLSAIFENKTLQNNTTLESLNLNFQSAFTFIIDPSVSNQHLKLIIILLNGSQIEISTTSSETVLNLKKAISHRQTIPDYQFDLQFEGNFLDNNSKKLSDYGIKDGCIISLTLPSNGVQGPNIKIMKTYSWNPKVPKWKIATHGTNNEGKCENQNCSIYGKMVINPIGFKLFDLLKDVPHCPICKKSIQIIKLGFAHCLWRYKGWKKGQLEPTRIPWQPAKDAYTTFDEVLAGMAEFKSLIIESCLGLIVLRQIEKLFLITEFYLIFAFFIN
jgi:hypothetical protein